MLLSATVDRDPVATRHSSSAGRGTDAYT